MRNDNTREILKVENITEKSRKARLRWFVYVKRRDKEYVGRETLKIVPRATGEESEEDRSKDGWAVSTGT